ncbi:MAG: PAS domain-containing sensor histidine kinase [Dehalococcoidales bacterium]|nr:PAS domain-containing sensor histidine kinase [Dehalococcoidales bacterium]
MSDFIFLVNSRGKILIVSASVSEVLGYRPDELIGRQFNSVLSKKTVKKTETDEPAVKSKPNNTEMFLATKNGRKIPVSVSRSPLVNEKGACSGFVYIASDVGELNDIQENLQKLYEREKDLRYEMESEIKKRVDFTRVLVHELKTPLAAVMSASELMDDERNGKVAANLIKIIRRGASNLNNIITELFDLAQGEIGMLQIKPVVIDPTPILHQVYDSIAPLIFSQNQLLVLDLPPALPEIIADKDRLQQILFNLIDNASKYNVNGGEITLRAEAKDHSLLISVRDTGRGIAKEDQLNLFNPYTRIESSRRTGGGLGLGLAICKILVELHAGEIWVESEKGKGSTFFVALPSIDKKSTPVV